MKRIIKLNENDLARIVRRVLNEDKSVAGCFSKTTLSMPKSCYPLLSKTCISDVAKMLKDALSKKSPLEYTIEIAKVLFCLNTPQGAIELIKKEIPQIFRELNGGDRMTPEEFILYMKKKHGELNNGELNKKLTGKDGCVKSMALIDPNTGKPAYIDSKTGKYCNPKDK